MINDPSWALIEDPAILRMPESYTYQTETRDGREIICGVDVTGETRVLWPEERPIEYLLRERRSMGAQLFAREFQHAVQDDSASAFRYEWLRDAQERGKSLSMYSFPPVERLEIVQGWDFSLVQNVAQAEARDTDYTVGTTWARDLDTGDHYLLGLFRKRGLTPAQLRDAVIREFDAFGGRVSQIAVERNAFGEMHYVGLKTSTDLPIVPHLTTGAKKADPWSGVASLSVLFENNKVILPSRNEGDRRAIEPLIAELWGLGREKHDDTVLSLWIAHSVLRKERFAHRYIDTRGVLTDERGHEEVDEHEDQGLARWWQDVLRNDYH